MVLNVNQFAMSTVQGQLDLLFQGGVVSAAVDAAQATALVAGQAVKLATTTAGVPKLLALTANTDQTFGFVARNLKDISYPTFAACEVAINDSVMWMTAGGAITRGARVEVSYAANKVVTSGGVNPVIGWAYDGAAADGDLIRVMIATPTLYCVTAAAQLSTVTATLAEINAGKVLIPGVTGQLITVSNYSLRVNGSSFAGGTNIILQSTNVTPVVITTIAEAGLVSGAILQPGSANTTLGAGFVAPLGSGDGVKIISTGTQTTATGATVTITYKQA